MLVVHQFTTEPRPCAYLPDRTASLEYSVAPILEAGEYEALMNRGCRKFGIAFFRPVCFGCTQCRPIRFALDDFKPDRKQRRAVRNNAHLEVRVGPPVTDMVRLTLFRRYHLAQSITKLWPYYTETLEGYDFGFVESPIPTSEISIWEDGVLRGVLITENTPNVVSAVYHYYDPDFRHRSLGTFLIMQCIELARALEKRWMYLGYYVEGCASMAYKKRFRPCEILGPDCVWRRED